MGCKNSTQILHSINKENILKRNLTDDVDRHQSELETFVSRTQKLDETFKIEKLEIADEILKYKNDFDRINERQEKYRILIEEVMNRYEKEFKRFELKLDQLQESLKISKVETSDLPNKIDFKLFELKEKQIQYGYKIERAEMDLDFRRLKTEYYSINNKKRYFCNQMNSEILKYENSFKMYEMRSKQLSENIRLQKEEIQKELNMYRNDNSSNDKLGQFQKVFESFESAKNQISESIKVNKLEYDTQSVKFKKDLDECMKKYHEAKETCTKIGESFKKIKISEKEYLEKFKTQKQELIKSSSKQEEIDLNQTLFFEKAPMYQNPKITE